MSWRTVIITGRCKLDFKMGYLVVRGEQTTRVFLDEVAILVIENPALSLTGCLIEALTEKKIKVIFCDSKRSPAAELVPCHGSHDSSLKIRTQAAWSADIKAAVWREIISEKIRRQAGLLCELSHTREAELLSSYIPHVELMDSTNREGHAAKVYFNALFGMEFSRGAGEGPVNAALNYGYSLLLSAFNREVTACGYLTQLGLFHDNVFNHFNLSCDLMEPFRPLVDMHVAAAPPAALEPEEKRRLLALLHAPVRIAQSEQTVLNAIRIYARSVFDALDAGEAARIRFPDL